MATVDIHVSIVVHYIFYLLELLGRIVYLITNSLFEVFFLMFLHLKAISPLPNFGNCRGKLGNRHGTPNYFGIPNYYGTPNYCGTPKTLFQIPWGHDCSKRSRKEKVYRNSQSKRDADHGQAYFPNACSARRTPWSHSAYCLEHRRAEVGQLYCPKWNFDDSASIYAGVGHLGRRSAEAPQFNYPKAEVENSVSDKYFGGCSEVNPRPPAYASDLLKPSVRYVGVSRRSAEAQRFNYPKTEVENSVSDKYFGECSEVNPRPPAHASDLLKPSVRKRWSRSHVLRRIGGRLSVIRSKNVYSEIYSSNGIIVGTLVRIIIVENKEIIINRIIVENTERIILENIIIGIRTITGIIIRTTSTGASLLRATSTTSTGASLLRTTSTTSTGASLLRATSTTSTGASLLRTTSTTSTGASLLRSSISTSTSTTTSHNNGS